MTTTELKLGQLRYFILQYVKSNLNSPKPIAEMAHELNLTYRTTRLVIKELIASNVLEHTKDKTRTVLTKVKDESEWQIKENRKIKTWYQ